MDNWHMLLCSIHAVWYSIMNSITGTIMIYKKIIIIFYTPS